MKYMSVKEAAEKWGISVSRVYQYIRKKRIAGAYRVGKIWVIPEDTEKPSDPRNAVNEAII
jgi:excisionase family DNA binding protein